MKTNIIRVDFSPKIARRQSTPPRDEDISATKPYAERLKDMEREKLTWIKAERKS